MASIESLLNPAPELARLSLPSPTLSSSTESPTPSRQKKQKLTKDAAIFTRGKIRGELRYPPCEDRDEELTKLHREFQIHPLGSIAEYPRHIPYNSDKKTFQERTGRESFEVFQYTFRIPGEDRDWIVMWDYNIGLVRTTHLFKCNNYSKTTPGKVLDANRGLREICHSITGGALAAQGYWMPFEAAKAVSATFCWKIRYALTPLFGLDFPSMCIHPSDRALYGRMTIDPAIIKKATEAANLYRMLELRRTPVSVQSDPPRSSPYARPHHHFNRRHASSLSSAVSISSSSSPADYGDAVCVSPVSDYRNAFTPVNTPRSSGVRNINMNMSMGIPSPQIPPPQPRSVSSFSSKNNQTDNESGTNSDSSLYSDPAMSESDDSSSSSFSLNLSDCAVESQPSSSPRLVRPAPQSQSRRPRPGPGPGRFAREVKAAHALLSLYMQDATSDLDLDQQTPKARALRQARKRRRASA